jgi:hypothetical protein
MKTAAIAVLILLIAGLAGLMFVPGKIQTGDKRGAVRGQQSIEPC